MTALVVLLTTSSTATMVRSETLSVITYNVHGLPAFLIGDRSGKVEAIAQVLGKLRNRDTTAPTIIALQEVFDPRYHRTLVQMAAPSFPFTTVKNRGGAFGLGDGLVQLSEAAFTRPVRKDWKSCFGSLGLYASDCDTDKGFSYARHEIAPGAFVDVYNLHADAGGDRGSVAARRSNIRQLLAAMNSLSPVGTAVIVMGDTNARYTRTPRDNLNQLLEAGLRDVWVELRRDGEPPPSGRSVVAACRNAPASAECELVDKILYRSGTTVRFEPTSYEVLEAFRDKRGRRLSDHYPVAAKLDVRVTTSPTQLAELAPDARRKPGVARSASVPNN